ncbi:MAG TPA: class I SAM-dependent methyltransferase [Pyrinomonadaceae bacterium]|nr:class I SAM-dependent methyltransferase [Pyrinomonadaceae bacterium]
MAKTEKELAFLRDLYINDEWTRRFTDLVDKHLTFSDEDENFLYVNAGTGSHCFALRDRMDKNTAVFATCENEEMVQIARDKAIAVRSDVDFSTLRFEDDSFDAVLTDASFVRPADLATAFAESKRVVRSGGRIAVFLPAAGSFGEIFSLLWEVMFNEDLGAHGAAAEGMIREVPTLTQAEEIAKGEGLVNVKSHSATEVFEYENGAGFVASPLVAEFLLPVWLESLEEDDKSRVIEKLAQLIDAEDGNLSFRFSVKVALVTGEKE